jgi:NAD(P)-dependent dehydrogenase (short-subunit alcohol dehydrogenase family)
MELGFDGRVAIVTGGGGGLGRSHALELARRGASVVVNDLGASLGGEEGDVSRAQRTADEIVAAGGEAIADTSSVATPEGGEALVRAALDRFGRVDVVVNNAGILRDKSFAKADQPTVDSVVAVHLAGAFNVTRPAWAAFREQGFGRVIVTSSSAGLFGNFGQAAYGAAKMGLVGLVKVLAIEGAKYGITANAIAPTARTRMTEEQLGEQMAAALDPGLVSPVVAFLAHESCTLSGEVLSCGGGRVARVFVGTNAGWYAPQVSAEDVAAHLDTIMDASAPVLPSSSGEELGLLEAHLAAAEA